MSSRLAHSGALLSSIAFSAMPVQLAALRAAGLNGVARRSSRR